MDATRGFSFTKWYLDCVDASGRAAIAYWTALAWRGFALTWHSVLLHEPDRPALQRTSLARTAEPRRDARSITWQAPALGCVVTSAPRQTALAVRLLETELGALDWHCEAPAADMCVQITGRAPVRGPGYAERIVLTLPPWRLPIDELRWGRWVAADASRSLIWIDWRGAVPQTWTFVDGSRQPQDVVTDAGVVAGETSLRLDAPRTLAARSLADLIRAVPPLESRIPASLLALRQTRWLSAGTLRGADAMPFTGWAIHELVAFR